jgi:putative addiction module component (TIGR02574 family)
MTAIEMDSVLKMPVERRILWLEDVWDSIRPQSNKLPVPESHKRELDQRFKKYQADSSALLSEQQLKDAVNSRG